MSEDDRDKPRDQLIAELRKLRQSDRLFRQLADTMPQLVWTAADDGTVDYYNARSADYAGIARQSDDNWRWAPMLHEEDIQRTIDAWTHAVRTGQAYACEHRVRMADASYRWHLSRARLLPQDEERRWFGTATDIHDLKEAQVAQAESQKRLQLAQHAGRTGTFDWDIERNINTWSPEVEALYGLAPGTFDGTYEAWARLIHPDDLPEAERRVTGAIQTGEFSAEWRVVLPDGSIRWLAARAQISKNAEGRPVRMFGVNVDITHRKEAEHQLQSAKDELERANRAKDEFIAALSHELRTPLAPALLTLGMLQNNPSLPPDVLSDLAGIRHNVELETRLIDDLIDLTRVTEGKVELRLTRVDIHDLVHHAIDTCRDDAFYRKRLELHANLGATRHRAACDPGRLGQVLWNLLRNAVKFTPAGGSITVETSNPTPRTLRIDVVDTGIGIEPEALPNIFGAFEQGGREVTRRFGGLGLGLAVARTMVDLHHGSLGVESEGRDRGARFTVTIPVDAAAEEGAAPPPDHTPRKSVNTHQDPPSLRVLLVEDYEPMRRVMQRSLVALGHRVSVAGSVVEAMDAAASHPFDLVVSDLGLPDGNGHDLMRELRTRHRLPGIAVSGYGSEEDLTRSAEAGFHQHLTKPITADQLREALERVVKMV